LEVKCHFNTLSYNVDDFGNTEEKELKENGKNIPVTQENKLEYVQTYCYRCMAEEIKP
jgi:E3 ubiquitin-protein ligase HUWE1